MKVPSGGTLLVHILLVVLVTRSGAQYRNEKCDFATAAAVDNPTPVCLSCISHGVCTTAGVNETVDSGIAGEVVEPETVPAITYCSPGTYCSYDSDDKPQCTATPPAGSNCGCPAGSEKICYSDPYNALAYVNCEDLESPYHITCADAATPFDDADTEPPAAPVTECGCVAAKDVACPDCAENTYMINPGSYGCDDYFVCYETKAVFDGTTVITKFLETTPCSSGQCFDTTLEPCACGAAPTTPDSSLSECSECGSFIPNPEDLTTGQRCIPGSDLSVATNIIDVTESCTGDYSTEECKCGCIKGCDQLTDPDDNTKYWRCDANDMPIGDPVPCALEDTVFVQADCTCIPAPTPTPSPPPCLCGRLPVEDDGAAFYYCDDLSKTPEDCPSGSLFYPEKCKCYECPTCGYGQDPDEEECSTYFYCGAGKIQQTTCPNEGYCYDDAEDVCKCAPPGTLTTTTVASSTCTFTADPDKENCYMSNDDQIPVCCFDGMVWDQDKCECVNGPTTVLPTGGGSTVPPTGGGSTVPPTGEGSTVTPTGEGSTVPPTGEGSTVPPTGEGSTVPPTTQNPDDCPPCGYRPAPADSGNYDWEYCSNGNSVLDSCPPSIPTFDEDLCDCVA